MRKSCYDVNLAHSAVYTRYNGDYELDYDVLDMPWVRGYGQVADLQLAMSIDDSLKTLVSGLTENYDVNDFYSQMDDLLVKWTETESIPADQMNGAVNARELAIVNKFLNAGIEDNVPQDQKLYVEQAYQQIQNKLFVDLIAQTPIGNAFEINYDYTTDAIVYNDNTYNLIVQNLTNQDSHMASYMITQVLGNAGTLNVNKLAYAISEKGYGAALLSFLNSGFQLSESGEVTHLDPRMPHYIIGTESGDTISGGDQVDVIYGMDGDDVLNGYAGDDFLSGGAGNDVLNGGDGSDTLDGGTGDDIYIYEGDGADVVNDERWVTVARQEWYQSGWWIFKKWKSRWVYQDQLVDAGDDTIVFGDEISENEITFSREGNNLVIEQEGTNNKLTVNDWYDSLQRVEQFRFANGLVVNYNQITNYTGGTSASESISADGTDNFIVGKEGNDIIAGNLGNDIISDNSGNETYVFNLGDGHDVINDEAGVDKISLGSGIVQADIEYNRNGKDLVLSINDMEDSITIKNWFISDNNKIETIEFSDSSTVSSSDIEPIIASITATGFDDNIYGNANNNQIDGLSGDDYIEAGAGADTLIGGYGDDIMKGGTGDDLYYVDSTDDEIVELAGEGTDTVEASASFELPDNVEDINLTGSENINVRANELNNIITGNDGNNSIDMGLGNDAFIYSRGEGKDIILDSGGVDIIDLTDISPSEMLYIKDGDNLVLRIINNNDDAITIKDWYVDDANKIETIKFADNSTINPTQIEQVVIENDLVLS